MLFCTSEEAIETFIAHCDIAERDLLLPLGDVVMALSVLLRIKRSLDGAEIDRLISDRQVRKALAAEHRRRADWRKRALSTRSFEANVITTMTHCCLMQRTIRRNELGKSGVGPVADVPIGQSE
jgi:hypothetical protein